MNQVRSNHLPIRPCLLFCGPFGTDTEEVNLEPGHGALDTRFRIHRHAAAGSDQQESDAIDTDNSNAQASRTIPIYNRRGATENIVNNLYRRDDIQCVDTLTFRQTETVVGRQVCHMILGHRGQIRKCSMGNQTS